MPLIVVWFQLMLPSSELSDTLMESCYEICIIAALKSQNIMPNTCSVDVSTYYIFLYKHLNIVIQTMRTFINLLSDQCSPHFVCLDFQKLCTSKCRYHQSDNNTWLMELRIAEGTSTDSIKCFAENDRHANGFIRHHHLYRRSICIPHTFHLFHLVTSTLTQ